ncbi:MAG: Beta-barrel assembly-enhancing protease [Alphaproteobacteria bacterium MarineAlpha2_Bin1]|nr:MAG: Beta-barrel assembly-enhancing protease [Alphaproteobacteria bacterium MarineAlpha2_Bin1]
MKNIIKENDSKDIENILAICINHLNNNQAARSIKFLENQITTSPHPKLSFTLGNIYLAQGNPQKSIKYLLEASKQAPNVAEIYNNLSNAYLSDNNYERSEVSAIKCLEINDNFAEGWVTLANVRLKLKKVNESINALTRALRINPVMYEALINLANIYFDKNEINKSLELYKRAIIINNKSDDAYNGLGLINSAMGKIEDAIENFRYALKINPKNINALGNLATTYAKNDKIEDAILLYRDALSLQPENINLLSNFAFTLQDAGRFEEANKNFKKAFLLNKNESHLFPYLINSEMEICNWKNYSFNMEKLLELTNKKGGEPIPPFSLANSLANPKTRLEVAVNFTKKIENNILPFKKKFNHRNKTTKPKTKLNIGYISPDFRDHSLGQSFLAVIKTHNKEKFNFHGFATKVSNDLITDEIIEHFNSFQNISTLNTVEAAKAIYNQKIDILIDLAGHTKNTPLEILSLKPAPIQAHYLGYGSTIGSKNIDWLITDKIHTPVELYDFCSESLVLLPNSFMSAEYLEIKNNKISRDIEKLSEKSIVYANFNSPNKLDPKSFETWMKVLKNVPNSVLWLKMTSKQAQRNLVQEAEMLGVKADRLIFADRKNKKEHLARLKLADICLDNFLHNGGVTTIDALNAGIPVITLKGKNHTQRTGASILSAAGLHSCIKNDKIEYTNFCIELGLKKLRLKKLKARVKEKVKHSALFDNHLLSKNLEFGFEEMYKCWLNENKPKFIKI